MSSARSFCPTLSRTQGTLHSPPASTTFLMTGRTRSHHWRTTPLHNQNETPSEGDSNDDTEDPTWIQEAMGVAPENPVVPPLSTMRNGIAGFSVDSELGFVCILHYQKEGDENDEEASIDNESKQQFVYAVVSPSDRITVQSAEALCLVQLAGGLDLGSAVFPPDTLANLVARELDENDDGNSIGTEAFVEDLRLRVRLLAITAIQGSNDPKQSDTTTPFTPPPSSPQRDAKIAQSSPTLTSAVQSLPGLHDISPDLVTSAMRLHADSDGAIDRYAFSEVLNTLRQSKSSKCEGQTVKFLLTAQLAKADGSLTLVDFYAPAFETVGLALRYDVQVAVSESCVRESGAELDGMVGVFERFPVFRPLQELEEDAKIMDGFIPSMFFEETTPENDDKA